jgi:smad nuclear-interacting protein 1
VERDHPNGIDRVKKTVPYLMDLESTNGTYLNGDKMEAGRFYELLEKDVFKFGFSEREYVLLNEASAG